MCVVTLMDVPIRQPGVLEPDSALPLCLNPPAARIRLPLTLKDSEWVLAGLSKTQLFDRIEDSIRQNRTAAAGTWFDVLHDVEATELWA